MIPPQLSGLSDLTEVGRGGYGVVYRARQDRLRRYVAVKVLSTRLDQRAAERFAQECRALGAVSGHPHIVAVHEAGTTPDGEPYLVMPFCDGGSLADRLRHTGPLPWQEVLDIGVRLAGALETAHGAGILHRDIKPANVLVDSYATPRLADFGQARHADSELTGTGAVVATPGYSAPEVLSGAPASQHTDVYSLAATLLALINGRGPFSRHEGENVATVMYRVMSDPPVDLRQRGVPDPVCRVLERAVSKDPRQRPPTAAAFGQELQGVQRAGGLPVTALTVAGQPPSAPPPQGPAPTGPTPGSRAPATPGPTGQTVTVPTTPVTSAPVRRTPARRRALWISLFGTGVVLAVVVGLVFAMVLPDPPAPQGDPGDLLLVASDYGIDGLQADPSMETVFSQLFGAQGQPRATDLATCLELPVDRLHAWEPSAVYIRGTPMSESSGADEFTATQSAGLIMTDETAAGAMVRPWTVATFDSCKTYLLQVGIALVGNNALANPDDVTFTDLPPPDDLGGISYAGKRATVPLRSPTNGGVIGPLVIDLAIMSSGTSVIMAVVQSFPAAMQDEAHMATVSAMAHRLRTAR